MNPIRHIRGIRGLSRRSLGEGGVSPALTLQHFNSESVRKRRLSPRSHLPRNAERISAKYLSEWPELTKGQPRKETLRL
jgi:hypothetical protein